MRPVSKRWLLGDSRLQIAIGGLILSVSISILAWMYWQTLLLFLVIPLVPLFAYSIGQKPAPAKKACPVCRFRTTDPSYEYCPRDGHRLGNTATNRE